MECLKSKKGVLLEILLIVLPLTVQIYNIVASKLGVHPFAGNLITLVILLMTALFVFLKNIGLLSRIGEYKISVLFAISVLPAVLLNLDSDFEIIVREIGRASCRERV